MLSYSTSKNDKCFDDMVSIFNSINSEQERNELLS